MLFFFGRCLDALAIFAQNLVCESEAKWIDCVVYMFANFKSCCSLLKLFNTLTNTCIPSHPTKMKFGFIYYVSLCAIFVIMTIYIYTHSEEWDHTVCAVLLLNIFFVSLSFVCAFLSVCGFFFSLHISFIVDFVRIFQCMFLFVCFLVAIFMAAYFLIV